MKKNASYRKAPYGDASEKVGLRSPVDAMSSWPELKATRQKVLPSTGEMSHN